MNDKRSLDGTIGWMVGNPVAANLAMLVCLLGGLFALGHIKQEVFPDIELEMVSITVAYPGASPEEVEKGIVKPIEEAVGGLEGVKEVSGKANEGSGSVTVELIEGESLQKLADDIRTEVDRIRTFPVDAEEPQITVVSRKRQVLDLVIYGSPDRRVLHHYAELIRDQLITDPNITQIDITGLPPMEIAVHVPRAALRRYNLTLDEVARRIRNASLDLPFGGIKTPSGEVLLRMTERRDYGRQFASLPLVINNDGSRLLLDDIATIEDGFEDSDYEASFDGKPAVLIQVYRIGNQTPMDVSSAVRRHIEEIKSKLPLDIDVTIMRDRSDVYGQRVDLLLRNASMGLVLVLFALGLFLEIRLAFWVMMGIPISFLGSLLIIPYTGVSINMISLFAYIIALGIVVDDAIVIGENIYRHRQEGMAFIQAATQGAREVAMPVTFSILTNIATFMPLYFVPGVMGKLFRQIPVIVVSVFIISLLESIFVLPAHLAHQKERKRQGSGNFLYRGQQKFNSGFNWMVCHLYSSLLRFILRFRYVAVAVAIAGLVIALAWAASGRMGFQLFPKVESDDSEATVVMPYGTAVEKTAAIAQHMVRSAYKVQKKLKKTCITGVFAEVGKGGSHNLRIRAYLVDAVMREKIGVSTAEFTRLWRQECGPIIGVEYSRFAADAGGPGHGASMTVELAHSDVKILEKASKELAAAVSDLEYTTDVDDGYLPGKQQLDFSVLPEGKALGITAEQLGRQLRNAYYGAEVTRQLRGRNEVKIKVLLPKQERVSEYPLEEMVVHTLSGKEVMLRDVAIWKRGRAYTTINRRDQRRVVQVTADVEPRAKTPEVIDKLQAGLLPKLLSKYPGLSYSFQGHQAEQRESLGSLKTTFLFALLVVYALLAVPFRSYIQPLIVMSSIPFGIVGAVLGHLLMGYPLCLPSIFGIVALSGVVVNDSLVLVDCVNQMRLEKKITISEALVKSAIQRFRPILLTTITTFFGLMPIIFEPSRQARFIIPMAISLGFGILFATLITLGLVPCLYLIVEDLIILKSKVFGKK